MKVLNRVLTTSVLATSLALVSTPGSATDLMYTNSPKALQSATQLNALSGDFLSSKLQQDGLQNAMVSSVSLFYALSVLKGGAAGDTNDLLQSLLLKNADADIAVIAPALAQALQSPVAANSEGMGTFNLANSIWSTTGETNGMPFVFAETFQQDSFTYYDASAQSIDFLANGASEKVNQWADEKTHGLIPEVVDDKAMRTYQWLIMNAAYFEGSWAQPMYKLRARDNYQFTGLDGVTQPAEGVGARAIKGRVLDREDGSLAFSLPFAGYKYSFIIHAPSAEEANLERWLVEEAVADMPSVVVETLENRSELYELSVRMPSFNFADTVTMTKQSAITADLGLLPLYFKSANFSPMVDVEKTSPAVADTAVGLIKQDTKIELDEKGVKAAAVTMIAGITKTSVGPSFPRRDILIDRPFAFAIVENSSQTILFNGVLVQAEQSEDREEN